jgi:hypothetical protein
MPATVGADDDSLLSANGNMESAESYTHERTLLVLAFRAAPGMV